MAAVTPEQILESVPVGIENAARTAEICRSIKGVISPERCRRVLISWQKAGEVQVIQESNVFRWYR